MPCFACRNLSMSWLHPSDLTSRENEREAIEINWFLRETFARKLTTMINHWTSEQRLQSEHCFAACSKLINKKRGFGVWTMATKLLGHKFFEKFQCLWRKFKTKLLKIGVCFLSNVSMNNLTHKTRTPFIQCLYEETSERRLWTHSSYSR